MPYEHCSFWFAPRFGMPCSPYQQLTALVRSPEAKALGFVFDRQAAGSHEIWFNTTTTNRYTALVTSPWLPFQGM